MIEGLSGKDIIDFPFCLTPQETLAEELFALARKPKGFIRQLMPWEVAIGFGIHVGIDLVIVRRANGHHEREYGTFNLKEGVQ